MPVLAIKEHGYIFKSSEIKAEKRADSHGSTNAGLTFIQLTIPGTEQLSKPIFTVLQLDTES